MDRINANVFREMKNAKHGKKVNDIYAPKKRSPDKRKFLQPTGKYELFDDVPGANQYNPNQISSGKSNQMVSKQNQINQINDEQDLYYADPNNYTRDLKTNMVVSKNGVIPTNNSYNIHPNAHQSTGLPWPLFKNISGAIYSGVPHNVYVFPSHTFAKPKSISLK